MQKLGELLREARQLQNISVREVSRQLLLKPEIVEALESGDWQSLPEPAYVRGFIKNYAELLGQDSTRLLALYRAEFDEKKFPHKLSPLKNKRRFMFTPNKLIPLAFVLGVIAFIAYLVLQYTSILSAPKLTIYTPGDDTNTTASIIEVSGKTDKDAAISIDGELIASDASGNFARQIKLAEGRNVIEITASKRLSPKSKVTRVVRLAR